MGREENEGRGGQPALEKHVREHRAGWRPSWPSRGRGLGLGLQGGSRLCNHQKIKT